MVLEIWFCILTDDTFSAPVPVIELPFESFFILFYLFKYSSGLFSLPSVLLPSASLQLHLPVSLSFSRGSAYQLISAAEESA